MRQQEIPLRVELEKTRKKLEKRFWDDFDGF